MSHIHLCLGRCCWQPTRRPRKTLGETFGRRPISTLPQASAALQDAPAPSRSTAWVYCNVLHVYSLFCRLQSAMSTQACMLGSLRRPATPNDSPAHHCKAGSHTLLRALRLRCRLCQCLLHVRYHIAFIGSTAPPDISYLRTVASLAASRPALQHAGRLRHPS